MQSPELAVQELRRCVVDLKLSGVQIATHVSGPRGVDWTLDEKALFPVFKEAEALGAAIFVHPWDMMGSDLMRKYFLPWLVGMPAETSLAICSMIFGGVFERLPNLRVCFAHGGGAFPSTVGRIQHGFDVRPDLCARDTSISPRDHLGRFWADSLVHDADALDTIVRVFGEDKVCLGSDYPFPLGEYTPESRGMDYAAAELIDAMGCVDGDVEDEYAGAEGCCGGGRRSGAGEEEEDGEGKGENSSGCGCTASCCSKGESLGGAAAEEGGEAGWGRPPQRIWPQFTFSAAARGHTHPLGGAGSDGLVPLYTAASSSSSIPSALGACGGAAQQQQQQRPPARAGWTRARRRKVLGTNAFDWLGLRYEDFLRM
jgi:hypothetical protein